MSAKALRDNFQILVVASGDELTELSRAPDADLLRGFSLVAHAPGESLRATLFTDVSVAVIEVDPKDSRSLQRVSATRQQHPEVAIVAAVKNASVSLMRTLVREGISDVVALPFDIGELHQAAIHVATRREPLATESVLAPLTVICSSIGGCGATSIATHLSADLAAHDGSARGAVIVDLDLQFGSVADFLGVRPRGSIADLLGVRERLDEDLLRSVAVDAGSGLSVIAAPQSIMPLESVDTDDLLSLLSLLRRHYAHVVLDLPANWTNWTLSSVLTADAIVLVVELSVASLRQAKRCLDLFNSVGIDKAAIQIVANRVEKRLFRTIDLGDVEETLGHAALGSVALEAPLVNTAQDQGVLVGQIQRKSRFASGVAEIGARLRGSRLSRSI